MSPMTQLIIVAPLWASISITAAAFARHPRTRILSALSAYTSGIYLAGLFVQIARHF